ncbi:hypothetical protein EPI10_016020 [Gossypium australe]|uniref:Uncharacterized protein n=1 Tax=Gossypium australe TaxID=47621 RepID=A0A5B6VMG5_9ROSI|nr:hypothetical protein EPI10_016020 [Gossypium australe]
MPYMRNSREEYQGKRSILNELFRLKIEKARAPQVIRERRASQKRKKSLKETEEKRNIHHVLIAKGQVI